MICNTGVGLTPTVEGEVLTFQEQGLYDGLFLLADLETGTYWNHLTGEGLHGPNAGTVLATEPVLHTTVAQALAADPDALVAVSDHPRAAAQARRVGTLARLLESIRGVPAMFPATLGTEDDRRDRMDIGIGIWDADRRARYYSLSTVHEAGGAVLDTFAGKRVLIYDDPSTHSLQALYTEAEGFRWEGDVLQLDSGTRIENGLLLASDDRRVAVERPQQVFTRWYGFSLTFPDTDVFERPGAAES